MKSSIVSDNQLLMAAFSGRSHSGEVPMSRHTQLSSSMQSSLGNGE